MMIMRFNKNQILQDENGSTSVLIVILMIVLMAFGMAALTTAVASLRLAQQNMTFSKEYDDMESVAFEVEYDLLVLLQSIKEQISTEEATISTEDFQQLFLSKLEEEIISFLDSKQEQVQDATFTLETEQELEQEEQSIGRLSFTVQNEGEHQKNLSVSLNIYMPLPDSSINLNQTMEVTEWYEWQEGIGSVEEDIFFDDIFEEDTLEP